MAQEERLQKILAQSGVASRRKSEELILAGRVTVNGKVVKTLGTKATYLDDIKVDGNAIAKEDKVYYVLYKPTGYLTTVSDKLGRRTVMDLFTDFDKRNRLFPVGRLDYDSSGVLIVTNDGELDAKLTKSANEIEKEYTVRVSGKVSEAELNLVRRGVLIDGKKTKKAYCEILAYDKEYNTTQIKIIITEGRNREIRKIFSSIGHEVKKLRRDRFGCVTLEGLKKGTYRKLKIHEVKTLYSL